MKSKIRSNRGITLIALIITIIVLLILAGVSITMISSQDGILNKAVEAKETQERAKVDELANIAYMSAIMDGKKDNEIVKEVVEKLKEEGYTIETKSTEQQSLEDMTVEKENVEINESSEPVEIKIVLKYSNENNNKYYILVNKKYYEISLNEYGIEVSKNATDISKDTVKEDPTIEISGNDTNIITAEITKKTETEYTLTITPVGRGSSSITLKVKGTNKSKTINTTVISKTNIELEGEGTQSNPYKISTSSNLVYLAGIVNGGEHCSNMYFEITTDIADMSNWERSGSTIGNSNENYFDGIFDGKNHTIRNMHGLSLFGYVGKNAIIKEITIDSASINGEGVIVSYNEGTIDNCVNKNCTLNAGSNNAGGIVGNNNGNVKNCNADCATISARAGNIGAICGNNSGNIESCNISDCTINAIDDNNGNIGIICGNNNSKITGCNVKGDNLINSNAASKDNIVGIRGEKSEISNCTFGGVSI